VATLQTTRPTKPFDPAIVRGDFPCLRSEAAGPAPVAYLDSAATALKPLPVIRAVEEYYTDYPANVHRGIYQWSERATDEYESARSRLAEFLGASEPEQVVFTRGTTESINLVALSWGGAFLKPGDEVVATLLEHHSNLVPWQLATARAGARLKLAGVTDDGRLDLESFEEQLSARTRIVAITGMSNVLGTTPPLKVLVERAHAVGAVVVVDGAQSVPHLGIDVADLDVDFVAFSGHKLCGPTGVGALYAKREHLEAMPPLFVGGGMVLRVEATTAEWNELPWKFEAGTPPIAEAIGLRAAVDYLAQFDAEALRLHEQRLTRLAHEQLDDIRGVKRLGPAPEQKGGIVAFTVDGIHPHDLSQLLDREGVAVRAGHHCAMPLHQRFDTPASTRASFYLYNNEDDVTRLADAIRKAKRVFRLA
jgi:cysteine desulfurase/selenocysteine lyase